MKSFIQFCEEFQRLLGKAMGSSDTAYIKSDKAEKNGTRSNHAAASRAHKDAAYDYEDALKQAPEDRKMEILKAISVHQEKSQQHNARSVE